MLTILGSVQRRLGNLPAARASLQRSLALNPNDDEAHALLGLVEEKDDPVRAVEHFRKALELDPHLPGVHRELGYTLFQLGKHDEAESVLRQAVVEDASEALSHNCLGHVASLRDEWSRAKQEFLEAVTRAPDVGIYDAAFVTHGFVRDHEGNVMPFDAPGTGTAPGQGTIPTSINTQGRVSGFFYDAASVAHGFVRGEDRRDRDDRQN